MDKIDEIIIRLLSSDSRASNTELAQKLGMSESAVRRRVGNLVASGRIRKFTIEVDNANMSSAVTWVSVNPSVPTSEVSQKIKGIPGVEVVYETAGQFDIAVVVKGANIADLNRSVEGIRRVHGVISTNTSMVLRTIR